MNTTATQTGIVAVEDVTVGMPATITVGSDRYAARIVEVERYKTGAKAGQVKAVTAAFTDDDGNALECERYDHKTGEFERTLDTDRFLVTQTYDGSLRLVGRCEGKAAWWRSLTVGVVRPYFDLGF